MINYPTKKLGDVAKIEGGGTPSTTNPLFWNGDVPWLTPKELSDFSDSEIFDTERKITKEGLNRSSTKLFPAGTVLFTSRAPIGYVVIAGIEMATNQGFKNFICDKKILDSRFLYYFLKLRTKYLQSLGRGATFTEISKSILAKVDIPIPPLTTQKQIVERLDKIAEAQKLNDDLISKTDELFQSLLHKELNPVRDSKHSNGVNPAGPADAKAMAGKKNWEVKKLGDIAEVTSSKRIYQSEYVENGIPFYRTKEIVELSQDKLISLELFILNKRYDEIKSKFGVPQKGNILISAVGTIGISWIVPDDRKFYFKDGNLLWIKNINGAEPAFLKIVLDNFAKKISQMGVGGAYNALTIVKLKKVQIPVPPIKHQKQIVAKLSAVQDYKKQLLEQKAKLKELFDSSLSKSMRN